LFSIVEKSNNYASANDKTLKALGEMAICQKTFFLPFLPFFTYSICYWDVYRHFSGDGGFSAGEGIPRGEKFPRVKFPGKILEGQNLLEFLYRIIFMCLTFSCD